MPRKYLLAYRGLGTGVHPGGHAPVEAGSTAGLEGVGRTRLANAVDPMRPGLRAG